MNKKLYFIFSFLILAFLTSVSAHALDWGVLEDYEEEPDNFAMYKILNNIPIKYAIEIFHEEDYENVENSSGDKYEEMDRALISYLEEKRRMADFQSAIELSFNAWPADTKKMIIEEGRAEEFADIIPLLSKKIRLEKVEDREDADIVFIFSSKEDLQCGKRAAACIFLNKEPKEVFLEDPYETAQNKNKTIMERRKNLLLSNIIHELGHYYAFSDQYEDKGDSSPEYSTFNRIGNYDSIMAAQDDSALACDDVDGFINLIDITLHLRNKKWSDRAQDGWASFCNGRENGKGEFYQEEFYREAKLINKPDRVSGLYKQTFDEQGNLINTFLLDPLDLYGKEVKPSVVGYGMAGEIFDRENNRQYSCTYNDIGKGIIDIWETTTYEKFKYIREDLGGASWGCNQFDNDNLISFDVSFYDGICKLFSFYSFGNNMISFGIELTDNNEFSSIHYDILDVSQHNKNIKVKYPAYFSLYEEKGDLICSIEGSAGEDNLLEFSLKKENKIKLIEKDEEKLNEFALKYKTSKEEIVNNSYMVCNDLKKEINKEKYKYKCDYFRKVEKFYQSRAENKTL